MSELWLPPDHPEFCPPEDLKEQKQLNRIAAEVQYLQECVDLRARVAVLMGKICTLNEKMNWALFYLDDQDDTETSTALLQNRNEVLVIYGTGGEERSRPLPTRDIRIFTNEHFRMPEGMAYLCLDFSLDEDNDTQYRIDSFTQSEDGPITIGGETSPIFCITDEGELMAANLGRFTPNKWLMSGDFPLAIRPFGDWQNPIDKLHSLAIGRDLVGSIESLTPVHHGSKS